MLAADRGADFATITRNHLALLDQNAAIKERFLSEPDWLNLYGLPIRYEEREVDGQPQGLQMLRAQRTVFVIWNVPAPGTTVGRVNLQNVPDKVKKLSNVIIPDGAKAPVLAEPSSGSCRCSRWERPRRGLGRRPPRYPPRIERRWSRSTTRPMDPTGSTTPTGSATRRSPNGTASPPIRSGKVTALRLEANRLRGEIPSDLGQLAQPAGAFPQRQ